MTVKNSAEKRDTSYLRNRVNRCDELHHTVRANPTGISHGDIKALARRRSGAVARTGKGAAGYGSTHASYLFNICRGQAVHGKGLHGIKDGAVTSAAAEVSIECVFDLLGSWLGVCSKEAAKCETINETMDLNKPVHIHRHSRAAKSALSSIVCGQRFLDGVVFGFSPSTGKNKTQEIILTLRFPQ